MRPGATTHHTDSEQRYVPLTYIRSGNDLTVTMLPDSASATAPPGYYMLWIVDNQQRPCRRAWFVQVPRPPRPASTSSSWPCVVATVTMGSANSSEVVTLRALRHELEITTAAGKHFIGAVNRLYYAFSPRLAAWLVDHERARLATRDILVRPAAAVLRGLERATAPIPFTPIRHAVLMMTLVFLAVVGIAAAPALVALLAAHMAFPRANLRHSMSRKAPNSAVTDPMDRGEHHGR
jgi:hypothetical protein